MEFTYLGPKQNPTLVLPIRIDRNRYKVSKGKIDRSTIRANKGPRPDSTKIYVVFWNEEDGN